MVTETRKRKSLLDQKDEKNSAEAQTMTTVSEDDLLPILVQHKEDEKVICTHSDNNYLKSLIELYKDQVDILKKELNHKNNIILDLVQIVKDRNSNVAIDNGICGSSSNVAKLCNEDNNKPEVLSDRGCDGSDEYKGLWKYPKKPAKFVGTRIDKPSVVDQNRYSSLIHNEWLTQADTALDCDLQSIASNSEQQSNSSNDTTPPRKSRPRKKRTITIAGDSMLGGIKQWRMRKLMPKNNVHVKCFPGATTSDMADYIKPTMRRDPDVVVLHVGTNDLRSDSSSKEIAKSVMDIATNMKTEENDIIVSSIISRGDGYNEKAGTVNEHLMKFCMENDIVYLDNSNICLENLERGGTWGGLHLNDSGTELFKRNILDILEV